MQREFIKIVHNNIEKMENIISDFLSLQKLESSKVLNKYPTDFNLVVDNVLDEVITIIADKNAKINVDLKLKSKDNFINIDKEKIKTMLKNLVENALIYNDKEIPVIDIKVEESYEYLRISVKDNGIGVPEKELKNIFNRFYRVDKARTTNLGGTGLGLSLVKEVVDLYSGDINVISQEKLGTEFIIRILK
jgi:two-component system phosphate regulon sensor histidine kinase PhoR